VIADADYVLARLIKLESQITRILQKSLDTGDNRTAIAVSCELRRLLELEATIAARSAGTARHNPEKSELEQLKEVILDALADQPAARATLSAALAA
jgi:hypothetical protein